MSLFFFSIFAGVSKIQGIPNKELRSSSIVEKKKTQKVERIVPIEINGRKERSRSREKASNPFLDGTDSDTSKSKQDSPKPSNKLTNNAPLAKAEVRILDFTFAKKRKFYI